MAEKFPYDVPTEALLASMSDAELDALPYGALELSADGTILRVNEVEAGRTGLTVGDFVDRNFFRDVAPCTEVQEFAGAFREGVERGELKQTFRFLFPRFGVGMQEVVVHMMSSRPGTGWVLATCDALPDEPPPLQAA